MASACPFLRATPSPPDACYYYVDHDGEWSDEMKEQVRDGLAHVEEAMGKKLGDPEDPLLVSVRRGATVSMPRMMDTMLNLGLNDEVVVDLAEKIAESADFFSFGTNDLTQMTFGFCRDDAGTFLPYYVNEGLLERDPFQALDQEGIGELVRIASDRGRSTDESLKVGICGEHGGEPSSVSFCDETGLDYASCSPFRIPIARLVAAQSALEEAAHSPAASEEFMHSGGEVA